VLQLPKLLPRMGQLQDPPPQYLWHGGGHLHRECPEKTNAESTSSCCNCTLVEGEKPHPASYRGCSHAKGEEHNELPRDPLGGRSSLSSPHQSILMQLHCIKTTPATRGTADRGKASSTPCSSICHNTNFGKQVCEYSCPVHLTVTL
jgi:hypothetical protein